MQLRFLLTRDGRLGIHVSWCVRPRACWTLFDVTAETLRRLAPAPVVRALWWQGPSYLNRETRSACSRIARALSLASVPVGSPLYNILGFDQ